MSQAKHLCPICKKNPVTMPSWHCLECQEKRNAILRDPEVQKEFRKAQEEAASEQAASNKTFNATTAEERALWRPHHDRWMKFSRPFFEVMVKEGDAINSRLSKKQESIIDEAERKRDVSENTG